MKFKIGVTFTGTYRQKVNLIVNALLNLGFTKDDIFYDDWHDALINGIDADIELRKIYVDQCDCVVVFLANDYNTRSWTRGVEWRSIRTIINLIKGKKICLLNIDDVDINKIDGLSSYTDIAKKIDVLSDDEIAEFIKRRYELIITNPTVEKYTYESIKGTLPKSYENFEPIHKDYKYEYTKRQNFNIMDNSVDHNNGVSVISQLVKGEVVTTSFTESTQDKQKHVAKQK